MLTVSAALRPFLAACLIALLTIASGTAFGVAFGAFEESLKSGLQRSADDVLQQTYGGDVGKVKPVLDKAWTYYKRAHLHTGALGTQALVLTLLLAALSSVPLRLRQGAALAASLGGLGYGWFWFLAGRAAPALGGTSAAKEVWALLAQGSTALMVAGLLGAIVGVVWAWRAPTETPQRDGVVPVA
jgi:hypothetical protein